MVKPDTEYPPVDGSCWRVAWTSELSAFTVRMAEVGTVLAFDDLDAVESTLGAPLPWSLRARLETDQYLGGKEDLVDSGWSRPRRFVAMPGSADGQLVARRSRVRRRRHQR